MPIATRIHRADFPIRTSAILSLRGYIRTVHVAMHRSRPGLIEFWYECSDIDEWMEVRFWIHGTGTSFAHDRSNCPHVGTVLDHESQPGRILVWHIYAEYPMEERFIQ